jgi:hypothetical protein
MIINKLLSSFAFNTKQAPLHIGPTWMKPSIAELTFTMALYVHSLEAERIAMVGRGRCELYPALES